MEIKLEALPFDQAINFFKSKVVLTTKQFDKLQAKYRNLAFTIGGIAALDVLKDIYQELLKALEEGSTQQEFGDKVNQIFENKGWKGLTPYRLDNIFRTNIQTAYMVGHYQRMTDPDVIDQRPYWMYDAVLDGRTRPMHRALNDKVYPADHPFWDTWYPPNGYRCRCSVRSLSERDVKGKGLTVEQEVPKTVEVPGQGARALVPDPGFATNPAKVQWQPDMSKYPAPLRRAYERKQKGGS